MLGFLDEVFNVDNSFNNEFELHRKNIDELQQKDFDFDENNLFQPRVPIDEFNKLYNYNFSKESFENKILNSSIDKLTENKYSKDIIYCKKLRILLTEPIHDILPSYILTLFYYNDFINYNFKSEKKNNKKNINKTFEIDKESYEYAKLINGMKMLSSGFFNLEAVNTFFFNCLTIKKNYNEEIYDRKNRIVKNFSHLIKYQFIKYIYPIIRISKMNSDLGLNKRKHQENLDDNSNVTFKKPRKSNSIFKSKPQTAPTLSPPSSLNYPPLSSTISTHSPLSKKLKLKAWIIRMT